MKNILTHLVLLFMLLSLAKSADLGQENLQLPEFGDQELKIHQFAGYIGLFVSPQLGDTTNMNKLKLKGIEQFLTFTLQNPLENINIDKISLLQDISNPTLVVRKESKRPETSSIPTINEYVIRANAQNGAKVVEIHIKEAIKKGHKEYFVYIIQTSNGVFDNLVVLHNK